MAQPNLWAVLVAGLMPMVVGMLWYGPLFGKRWAAYMGIDLANMGKDMNPAKTYGVTLVMSIVTAYVLAHVLIAFSALNGTSGLMHGLQGGFWVWLGFVFTSQWNEAAFANKKVGHWLLDTGASLVGLLLMGAILGVWT